MSDDNEKKLNSDIHLDDIDEFFLKNFNVLIADDTKKKDTIEKREILTFDDIENNNNESFTKNNQKDIFDFDITPNENRENNTEVFDFELYEKPEILDDIDTNLNNEESKDILSFEIEKQEKNPVDVMDFEVETFSSFNELVSPYELNMPLKEDILDEQTREILDVKLYPEETKNKKTKKTKRKIGKTQKLILINLLITIVILLIAVIYKIVRWKMDNDAIKEQVQEVQNSVVIEEVIDNENTVIVEPVETEEEISDYYFDFIKMPLMNVNLEELKAKNSDTVGWLKVNGTNINYPIVQTTNNRFYLTRDFNKNYNEAGWVFADYRNNLVNDKNLIIYAHARLDLSMFGTLRYTTKANWYNNSENHLIKLSLENVNASYQVFSTYIIENEDYYIQTSFANDDEYKKFLEKIKSRSVYDYKVPLNENDQILTLSTCHTNDRRVVLHAKLIKKENR